MPRQAGAQRRTRAPCAAQVTAAAPASGGNRGQPSRSPGSEEPSIACAFQTAVSKMPTSLPGAPISSVGVSPATGHPLGR